MAWRDAGLEIIIAIIGTGLLGTSLSTYYDNVYYQPFIDISVRENQNEKLLDRSDYYEIAFKNTGQKSASNLQINIFFFANITNYTPIIHGEKPIFNLDNNISQNNNNLIKPSLLNASISKLPKNDIIILYVWTDPWAINKERFSTNDEYYITATYDEGSNYVASFNKKNADDLHSFFPYIEVDTNNTLSIQNIPFVTVLLSILTFAILFKIHRTKLRNKSLSMNSLDYYQSNEESKQKMFHYDLLVVVPIIFVSSTIILFTIEIPLQKFIFSFLPLFSLDLTTYNPINIGIGISEDRYLPLYLILVFSFFGSLVILIIRSIVTYTICIFILKYVINENIDISFRLGEGKNKKLFLLSLITMSFPLYTIIYSYFLDNISYNNLIYYIIIVEFIRLTSLLILNKLSINKNKLVKNLVRTSRILCFISGLLYILIGIIIGNKIMDIHSINIPLTTFLSDTNINSLSQNKYLLPILYSSVFFFIVGIIQITWASFLRKKTNTILYSLELSGLILLTIIWISLRVFLPMVIGNPTNTITINYFAFLDIVSLILNLGTIILSLQLLSIIIDYLIIKRESVLLKIKKSRMTSPKLIVSLLSIIIVLVLVPIIFFIPKATDSIFSKNYFAEDFKNGFFSYFRNDRSPMFEFDPVSGIFYFIPELYYGKECIKNIQVEEEYHSVECINNSNINIFNIDLDPIKRNLILLWKNTTISNTSFEDYGLFNISNINLGNKSTDFPLSSLNNVIRNPNFVVDLNSSNIYDIDIDPANNNLFILHDKKIDKIDMSTQFNSSNLGSNLKFKPVDSYNLETHSKKFVIDPYNNKIFLLNSRGLDVIDMNTKELSIHMDLDGVGQTIDYDYNNRKLYLSVTNSFKTFIYIIEPSSYQLINKIEVDGYPLHIGITTGLVPTTNSTILSLTKGPDRISQYNIDEFGVVQKGNFVSIPDFIESF